MEKIISQDLITPGLKDNYRGFTTVCLVLILIGVVTFLSGISGPQAQRVWMAYLINYLFWSGLAFAAVLFVAIINMTNARWARPLKRIAEAPGAFLPISFLLFWFLYFGRHEIFPWIRKPVEGKEVWLNTGFLFARDGAGLFLLTVASLALLYYSVRSDARSASELVPASQGSGLVPSGDDPSEKERKIQRDWYIQTVLSPVVGILYGTVLTLIAFDLVMSLDPHWYSTLFGGYYFIGSFYTALAALVVLTVLCRKRMGMEKFLGDQQFHDLGKLLFAFCMVTGYLFFAQFLTIWYGNLPEETRYVILRVRTTPWEPVAWVVLSAIFAIPFIVLLSRKVKMKPRFMFALAALILIGMWLERFVLVAPSLWKQEGIPLGLPEIGITAGFFGAMAWTIMIFLKRFPLLPLSDPLFHEYLTVGVVEEEE